jgi:protein ImuA
MTLLQPRTLSDRRAARDERPLLPRGAGGLGLAAGRVHEVCGPARRTLAAMAAGAAGRAGGPVLWILPAWLPERPMAGGLQPWMEPGRLILVLARRAEDILWAAEEALRAGVVPLVVAETPVPPALTPVRRLQLAAEAGTASGGAAPTGLLLTPQDGGAAGAETRWHMAAVPGGGWRLERRRARLAPPAAWTLSPGRAGLAVAAAG